MSNKPVVQIRNLKKIIGKKVIINDISFDIYPGEVFGFLGPNGAGKTTTIKMMVGLMAITEGQVLIKGKSIKENYQEAIIHVGAIVENPEMYKFLTGYQNLIHYSRMFSGIAKVRIDEVVKLVGLEKRIHDKVKTYSLGMRQRLGIAQALLHSPSLLILDEPTNGLDPAGIREIRDYLRKLAQEEGISVMVSSHLLSEMEMMCDRVGIIQNGKVIGVQTVKEFTTDSRNLSVSFEIEPLNDAVQLLKTSDIILPEQLISSQQNKILLALEREEIPAITNYLTNNGIKIYGINTLAKSLEEKFLEVTGGNEIE